MQDLILEITNLADKFKSATSFDSFKDNIKKYFLNKLGDVEADIYRHINLIWKGNL